MKTDELKFVLKLLGCPNYRSSLSAFSGFKSKNQILQALNASNILDFTREIATIQILPTGKELLKLDKSVLSFDEYEWKILETIAKTSGSITPSKLKIKSIKVDRRNAILQTLADRGFIAIATQVKRQKAEVWLTEYGLTYLREEFVPPKKSQLVISLELLGNYLAFLRQSSDIKILPSPETKTSYSIPTNEEILQIVKDLEQKLNTGNYLPIFYLREKLQPPLTREELDQALYRLQKENKIELSAIVHSQDYTPEQIQAGIQQRVGIPLFFIQVL